MSRLVVVAAMVVGFAVLAGSTIAYAEWTIRSAAAVGYAKAGALPRGNTPQAIVHNGSVLVSWQASQATGTGHRLIRYGPDGRPHATRGSCDGLVTATACHEPADPGVWTYTVRPVLGPYWTGVESFRSTPVTVDDPKPKAKVAAKVEVQREQPEAEPSPAPSRTAGPSPTPSPSIAASDGVP